MCQFPEKVGGMRVCVSGGCCAYTGVDADEYANEIESERVGEVIA